MRAQEATSGGHRCQGPGRVRARRAITLGPEQGLVLHTIIQAHQWRPVVEGTAGGLIARGPRHAAGGLRGVKGPVPLLPQHSSSTWEIVCELDMQPNPQRESPSRATGGQAPPARPSTSRQGRFNQCAVALPAQSRCRR